MWNILMFPFRLVGSVVGFVFDLVGSIFGFAIGLVGSLFGILFGGLFLALAIIGILALIRWFVRGVRDV